MIHNVVIGFTGKRCRVRTGTVALAIFFWVASLAYTSGSLVTCEASMNQMASVTCHFPYDLSDTRRDFIVKYFKPNVEKSNIVLSCNWYGKASPTCNTDMVSFRSAVTHQLTVTVDPNKTPVGGEFLCGLVPLQDTSSERCYLNYTIAPDVTNTSPVASTSTAPNDSPPCTRDRGYMQSDVDGGSSVALPVVLTLFFTILFCCTIFSLLLWKSEQSLKDLIKKAVCRRSEDECSNHDEKKSRSRTNEADALQSDTDIV
ncbi:hypothetical protein ACOMHN_054349 [Nucella lapillus]